MAPCSVSYSIVVSVCGTDVETLPPALVLKVQQWAQGQACFTAGVQSSLILQEGSYMLPLTPQHIQTPQHA